MVSVRQQRLGGGATARRSRPLIRVLLLCLTVQGALTGGWATIAAKSWYSSYPGFGRSWIGSDGPYNAHIIAMIGGMYLGMTVVTIAAMVTRTAVMARVAGAAWLVAGLPHFIYHATNRSFDLSTGDLTLCLITQALVLLVGLVCTITPADQQISEA